MIANNLQKENLLVYGLNAAMHTADCIKIQREPVIEEDAPNVFVPLECQ